MRYAFFLFSLCSILIGVSFSGAALPITTIADDSPPTTAPAPVSVLLLPFRVVDQNGDNAWISEAIDDGLAHDLSRNHAIKLLRPATTQPVPAAAGLAAARDANAQRLISGSMQVVDDQLRITAEVVDVNQTKPADEVRATGRVRDLFQLEDSLAMQLWHILPQPQEQPTASDIQVTPLQDNVVTQQDTGPQVIYEPLQNDVPSASDYGGYSNYYSPAAAVYPYANYGYGYPYGFGYPLFITGGFGRGFFHRGGGFHNSGGGGFHGSVGGGGSRPPGVSHPIAPHPTVSPGFRGGGGAAFGGHR